MPWPHVETARKGAGQIVEVALAVPPRSFPYWQGRLASVGVQPGEVEVRFGERTLPLEDPHGLSLALEALGFVERGEQAGSTLAPDGPADGSQTNASNVSPTGARARRTDGQPRLTEDEGQIQKLDPA